jgi:hypothetical protein
MPVRQVITGICMLVVLIPLTYSFIYEQAIARHYSYLSFVRSLGNMQKGKR